MTLTADRRSLLAGLGAVASLGVTGQAGASPVTGLKDRAARKGMRFGSALSAASPARQIGTLYDAGYRTILERDCTLLVPENEMKIYVTHVQPDAYNFAPGDAIMDYGRTHQMAVRGHNLIWARDEFTPAWLKAHDFGTEPAKASESLIRDYVSHILSHFGETIASWDVVNECVSPQTGKVRDTIWTRHLGPEAFKIAYQAARSLSPNTQLVYNDYMSWEVGNETHRQGVLDLLRWFRAHDVPVDALGVQSHLGTGFTLTAAQEKEWRHFLDQVTEMGYGLLITELDVNDHDPEPDVSRRDKVNAAVLKTYLDLMFSYGQLKDVLAWGMVSKYSWLQGFTPRADKKPQRPTLYDDAYQPTALYEALASAFDAASLR